MDNAHEITLCIGACDPDGIPTGTGSTPESGEPSFRYRVQNRRPTNQLELVAAFIAVAEEIERLHIECARAPWFPKYNAGRLAKNSTLSTPILPVAPPRGRT